MPDKLLVRHLVSDEVKWIDEVDLTTVYNGKKLFSFNEYDHVELYLDSERFKVEIECIEYLLDDEKHLCENNVLSLNPNKGYIISNGNDDDTVCYMPSKYQIVVTDGRGLNNNCFFEVCYNSAVSQEGMNNIIAKIEEFISGLSIDFFHKAPVSSIKTNELNDDYRIYETLLNNANMINYHSNNLLNNFKLNVTTKYSCDRFEQRQNSTTIRRNANESVRGTNHFWNVKKGLTSFNNENIILKRYILKIMDIMKNAFLDLEETYQSKLVKQSLLKEEIIHEQEDKNEGVSKLSGYNLNNRILVLNKELQESKQVNDKIGDWLRAYRSVNNYLNRLLNCDELKSLDTNTQILFDHSFYGNPDYRYFMQLYNELSSNSKQRINFSGTSMFLNKKSYVLFEIYGFIIIQNILKQLGFKLDASSDKSLFNFGSESIMKYENDDYMVEVQYDHFCQRYYKANPNTVISINSVKSKPDYIITFFDKEHHFKDMIIIDMKYRKLKNILGKGITSDIDDILSDYIQLEYYDDQGSLFKPSNVAIIYPSIEEESFRRYFWDIIGIDVSLNFDSSKGYQYLKNIIEHCLS